MTEDEIRQIETSGIINSYCSDEQFELIKKWYDENKPVAIRIIGFYKIDGYRMPLAPTEGWEELNRAYQLGDLMAQTFIGLAYTRGMRSKFFNVTPTMLTYSKGISMLEDASAKGWNPASEILNSFYNK